jgi:hypothetical protein
MGKMRSPILTKLRGFAIATIIIFYTVLGASLLTTRSAQAAGSSSSSSCPAGGSFFGLVPWYQYIPPSHFSVDSSDGHCDFSTNFNQVQGSGDNSAVTGVSATGLSVIWLIALAVFEDLLRVAGLVAVGFTIYGGIRYMTSQGEPEATKGAAATITNALIGLAIAVLAATTVAFIAKKLG